MLKFLMPALCLLTAHPALSGSVDKQGASATIVNRNGKAIGKAKIISTQKGLRVKVRVNGLAMGQHGVHVHSVGRCDDPTFASAGPHWNPTSKLHGLNNPNGSHIGDLPNMQLSKQGRGRLSYYITGATLMGDAGLFDADGAAIVVHANTDDQRTDPSGNSGDRIACGVFRRD
jgi:Cu-Zn family superoxide dismutase